MNYKKLKIYFITGNNNKFIEVSKEFEENQMRYGLEQLNIETKEIQASSLEEVAIFKLKSVKNEINGSFFVEDAGFFVEKPLNGFPGVYSSYVFKTLGNEGILKLIEEFDNTEAHFTAIIALYHEPTNKIHLFKGKVMGTISNKIRGNYGFGFDPIFIPNKIPSNTFGELTTNEKNKISHRGIALKKMMKFLSIH